MDDLRTRLDTLEQQTAALAYHTRHVTRQLRWWRGGACGLLALALLTWALPVSTAQEDRHSDWRGLPARVAALEQTLRHVTRGADAEGHDEVVITGANLRIVNGLGRTDCTDEQGGEIPDCPNGVGNLIVGYNEPRAGEDAENIRTGSHNVVVGRGHNFSRFGGLVVGLGNTISGAFAVVSGGGGNTASGDGSAVSGGEGNTASGLTASGLDDLNGFASVSGGQGNTASGFISWVGGGRNNSAFGSSIIGGPSAYGASVSGGEGNTANGHMVSVSGGRNNTAIGDFEVVSGGQNNTAEGSWSVVSGGRNRTTEFGGDFDWVAGPLFADE